MTRLGMSSMFGSNRTAFRVTLSSVEPLRAYPVRWIDSSHRAVLGPVRKTGKLCFSVYRSTTWRASVSVRRWAEV